VVVALPDRLCHALQGTPRSTEREGRGDRERTSHAYVRVHAARVDTGLYRGSRDVHLGGAASRRTCLKTTPPTFRSSLTRRGGAHATSPLSASIASTAQTLRPTPYLAPTTRTHTHRQTSRRESGPYASTHTHSPPASYHAPLPLRQPLSSCWHSLCVHGLGNRVR
jgi:hypothetical protein